MPPETPRSTWQPTASIERLRLRSRILQSVRDFFLKAGYWEAETPLLSHDTVVDAHLDPIVAHFQARGSSEQVPLYLQTSPEFGMNRLVAAGADRIFQLGRVFRNGEVGDRHNPEFTMLEWYRVGDSMHDQMTFTERMMRDVHRTLGDEAVVPVPEAPFERMSYDEAFEHAFGRRVLKLSAGELVQLADAHEVMLPASMPLDDRDNLLNILLAFKVEPWLAQRGAVFVYDFPASQSALAVVRDDDPPVAERFELYWNGVELCNGYHELTDPEELRRRTQRQNEVRVAEGAAPLPADNRLLSAMSAGLPRCAGVAVGFDRLLMTLLGETKLSGVIAFPFDRA